MLLLMKEFQKRIKGKNNFFIMPNFNGVPEAAKDQSNQAPSKLNSTGPTSRRHHFRLSQLHRHHYTIANYWNEWIRQTGGKKQKN